MIEWLPKLSVGRPVTVVMAFTAFILLGFIAWARIPLQMMPSGFEIQELWVWAPYGESTPQQVEKDITHVLEEHVSTVAGLKSMNTRSRSSSAGMGLEFTRNTDMDAAYNAVADRLDRAMVDLPEDLERVFIWRFDPSDEPVIWAGISMPENTEEPPWVLAERIGKRLERVDGVAKVDVWGVDPKRVFIDFSLDDIIRNRVSLYDVIGRLGRDNFQGSGGRILDRGRVRYVRSLARYGDLEELATVPIGNGKVLRDVAAITYREDPSPNIGRINGSDGAALAINKESGANTVATTRAVAEVFRELEGDPRLGGSKFYTFFDQGEVISDSLANLTTTALYGGFFAIIVLYVFLREWRMTLLIAACIPFTLLLTVTALYFTGGTLNLLSLMGLMLAVGMVVDNSIVVVEAIYARRTRGEAARSAAVSGAAEVGLAITMSTATTMVVFLPIILMSEDATFSFFMGELGFPVVWALGASLLVALVFTPLTTTLLRGDSLPQEPRSIAWMTERYSRSLSWVLHHRTDALVWVLAVGFLTFVVPFKAVDCQGESEGNIGDFVIRYTMPSAFSYYERVEVVDAIESFVEENRDKWGVRVHRSWMDSTSNRARTFVYLDPDPDQAAMPRDDVIEDVKASLPEIPGVEAQVGWGGGQGGPTNTINLSLRGEDTSTLDELAVEVERRIRSVPGVLAVSSELEEEGGEEIRLYVDREASARNGLSAMRIGRTVGFALRGSQLPDYIDGDKEVDVVGRFRLEDRQDLDRILDFPMFSEATMSSVPVRALVHPQVTPGYGTIHRENRITDYPLTVDLDKDADSDQVRAAIGAVLANMSFPQGYSTSWGMELMDQEEDTQAQQLAMVMSIVFVFLIMGVLFESFAMPLSIITTIPMAMFGVYWTLYLTDTPLDVMGGVGLVILVGVVVNNGIVLVDLVTRLRSEGMERTMALVEGARHRLRPILMTALTTIFGLLPMAFGSSTFIGIPYAPMGRVVVGGLVAGTILTLFFVPYLYSVIDDMRQTAVRWLVWIRGAAQVEAE